MNLFLNSYFKLFFNFFLKSEINVSVTFKNLF